MIKKEFFNGWSLEDWSLQYQLLELRFNLWPVLQENSSRDLPNLNKVGPYRGKGIFIKPRRIEFHAFVPRAIVTSTIVFRKSDDLVAHRFSLGADAFVDVEAENFVPVEW